MGDIVSRCHSCLLGGEGGVSLLFSLLWLIFNCNFIINLFILIVLSIVVWLYGLCVCPPLAAVDFYVIGMISGASVAYRYLSFKTMRGLFFCSE